MLTRRRAPDPAPIGSRPDLRRAPGRSADRRWVPAELDEHAIERLQVEPNQPGAAQAARCELVAEFLEDLRRIDAQMRDAKKKLTIAVRASGTTLTEVFGVGPIVAATVIGEVRDVSRFNDRDRFAACNGTAPIEVPAGRRKVYRLSRRGSRRHGHAIHMAAVTQVSHHGAQGALARRSARPRPASAAGTAHPPHGTSAAGAFPPAPRASGRRANAR
jgi:transposase